jgi:hypothetical protein
VAIPDGILTAKLFPHRLNFTFMARTWIYIGYPSSDNAGSTATLGQLFGSGVHHHPPLPDTNNLKETNALALFASPDGRDGRDGSIEIRQDAEIHFGQLDADQKLKVQPSPLDGTWIHLIKGGIKLLGESLTAGDSAGIDRSENGLQLTATDDAEFLLFRLS